MFRIDDHMSPKSNSACLKTVNVGFDGAGKTCLYHTFAWNKFPGDFIPTIFECYVHNFVIEGESVDLGFWDTHCGENDEYVELTRIYYHDADVFTICFDVSNREVFPKIKDYWVDTELRPLNPKAPIILVATKIDLRDGDCETISKESGERLAEEIGAAGYFEVSSLKMVGLNELFNFVCAAGLKYRSETQNSLKAHKICDIL